MTRLVFALSLSVLLFSTGVPVLADQYDDCVSACNEALSPCTDQAKLNAGNVQEEQDSIAACEKSKADCIQACSAAEAQPQAPPQEQPDQQPQDQSQH